MYAKDSHPLDVELFDHVVEALDDRANAELVEHLDECLLCRVRIARIRRQNPSQGSFAAAHAAVDVSPVVQAVLSSGARPDRVEEGQVWLAGEARRTLIWIRAVRDSGVICHPATIDVEAADDSTLIVEEFAPLGYPLAVVTSIVGTVPTDRLTTFVGALDIAEDVNRLRDAALTGARPEPGLRTGPPMTGRADERLEFRQLLADDLAALDPAEGDDPHDPDESTEPDPIVGRLIDTLRTDVVDRRGAACHLSPIRDSGIGGYANSVGCTAVARLREFDCSVLVVTGVDRMQWALTHQPETTHLLWLADASALAVAEPVDPFDTCMFELRDLRPAFELPNAGERSNPRVGLSPRPLAKAVYDFFDISAFPVEEAPRFPEPVAQRELGDLFGRHAAEAIEELRTKGAQLSKREALRGLSEDDGIGLAAALESSGDTETLFAELDRIAES